MKIVRRRGSCGEQTNVPCRTIGQLRIWWYQEPQKVGDATEVWKQNWLKVHTWSIGPLPRQYCGDSECLLMAGRSGRRGYLPGQEAFMFMLFLKYSEGPLHWGSGSGLNVNIANHVFPKGSERRKSSLLQNSFLESTQPSGCNSLSTQTPKLRIKTSQTFRRRRRRKKKKKKNKVSQAGALKHSIIPLLGIGLNGPSSSK